MQASRICVHASTCGTHTPALLQCQLWNWSGEKTALQHSTREALCAGCCAGFDYSSCSVILNPPALEDGAITCPDLVLPSILHHLHPFNLPQVEADPCLKTLLQQVLSEFPPADTTIASTNLDLHTEIQHTGNQSEWLAFITREWATGVGMISIQSSALFHLKGKNT